MDEIDMDEIDAMTPVAPAPVNRWRGQAAGAGLVAGGLLLGGVITGTLTANAQTAATTSPPAATSEDGTADDDTVDEGTAAVTPVDPSQPQWTDDRRADEELLTGDTLTQVTEAALAEYPGATIERVETDSDGVYEAHLVTADGVRVTVELDADFAVTGTEEGGPGGGPCWGHGGPGHRPGDAAGDAWGDTGTTGSATDTA